MNWLVLAIAIVWPLLGLWGWWTIINWGRSNVTVGDLIAALGCMLYGPVIFVIIAVETDWGRGWWSKVVWRRDN